MNTINNLSFQDTSIAFASRSDKALRKMLRLFRLMNNKLLTKIGIFFIKYAFLLHLPIKSLMKKKIFLHFCGGETIKDCEKTIRELAKYNIKSIIEYSVEGSETEERFDQVTNQIIATFKRAKDADNIPFCVFKITGIASGELFEKVQRRADLSSSEQKAFLQVKKRIIRIFKKADEYRVKVLIDAEESWIQESIDFIADRMMKKYNKHQTMIYNTYQMYRWDRLKIIKEANHKAEREKYFIGAKLVRGAYMEKERAMAKKKGCKSPIYADKQGTDAAFDNALSFCIDHLDKIAIFSGTHNEQSCYHLIELMNKNNIPPDDPRIYFVQLYGMSDHISYNLSKLGYNVAKTIAYGPVNLVLPYLFRRAEENTSIAGQSSRELQLIKKEIYRRKKLRP